MPEKKTYDEWLADVRKGTDFSQVPEAFWTEELLIASMDSNGWGLEDVPEEKKTFDVAMAAFKKLMDIGDYDEDFLNHVPDGMRDLISQYAEEYDEDD